MFYYQFLCAHYNSISKSVQITSPKKFQQKNSKKKLNNLSNIFLVESSHKKCVQLFFSNRKMSIFCKKSCYNSSHKGIFSKTPFNYFFISLCVFYLPFFQIPKRQTTVLPAISCFLGAGKKRQLMAGWPATYGRKYCRPKCSKGLYLFT